MDIADKRQLAIELIEARRLRIAARLNRELNIEGEASVLSCSAKER
jgi:hypothetical protein